MLKQKQAKNTKKPLKEQLSEDPNFPFNVIFVHGANKIESSRGEGAQMRMSRSQQEAGPPWDSGLVTFLGQSFLALQRWGCCGGVTICPGMLGPLIQVSWPQTPVIGPVGRVRD